MAKTTKQSGIRLNKYLADCGISSRRKADLLIDNGSVKINGRPVYELGTRINPASDKVTVKGRPVSPQRHKYYIMLNKPVSVLTSTVDPEGRPTVLDLIGRKINARLFPVGRLDWDSEGLILLTNDGDFAQSVMHPTQDIPKIYLVKLNGKPSRDQLNKLMTGISIIGGRVRAEDVERLPSRGSDKYDWVKISVTEGRNRQIRQMFEKIGFDVKKLKRIAIGGLELGALKKGQWQILSPQQLQKIFFNPLKEKKIRALNRPKPKRV